MLVELLETVEPAEEEPEADELEMEVVFFVTNSLLTDCVALTPIGGPLADLNDPVICWIMALAVPVTEVAEIVELFDTVLVG